MPLSIIKAEIFHVTNLRFSRDNVLIKPNKGNGIIILKCDKYVKVKYVKKTRKSLV